MGPGRKSISPPFPECPTAIGVDAYASGFWPTSKANLIYKCILNYTFLVSHNDSPILPVGIKNQHVLLSPRRDTFGDAFEVPWTFVCTAVGGKTRNDFYIFHGQASIFFKKKPLFRIGLFRIILQLEI